MPYLSAQDVRTAVAVLADAQRYPDATLEDLIAEFEELAEDYRGVAFIPREAVETHTVPLSCPSILLTHHRVRSITSVVLDGTTVDADSYTVTDAGLLVSRVGFLSSTTQATASAVVTLQHGYTTPPRAVLRACREYVRAVAQLDRSNVGREVIFTSADGATSRYSTPDKSAGRPTGFLEVDRLLNSVADERMGFA